MCFYSGIKNSKETARENTSHNPTQDKDKFTTKENEIPPIFIEFIEKIDEECRSEHSLYPEKSERENTEINMRGTEFLMLLYIYVPCDAKTQTTDTYLWLTQGVVPYESY